MLTGRRFATLVSLGLLVASACRHQPSPDREGPSAASETRTAAVITDQTNGGGKTGFYWIPPIVTAGAAFTTLDQIGGSNNLSVSIDQLFADSTIAAKTSFTGAAITMVTGSSNASFPGVTGPFYGVNWAAGTTVASGETYRVTVRALTPARVLGIADVQVVADAAGAGGVDRTKFTPLIVGNTLPIVFRLEAKDTDGDTLNDWRDNCAFTKNISQLDSDADNRGDACQCLNVPNGTACSTGCKTGMTCQSGACTGGSNVANGTACSTGNPCKQSETCTNGACGGGSNKTGSCSTGNPCKQSETCSSGVCGGGSNRTGSCSTGNPCKQSETCSSGACGGGSNKTGSCSTGNPCKQSETCSSGVCGGGSNKANGTACGDANLCTQTDTCQSGICTGSSPITCVADQCHNTGSCDKATGVCPARKTNGTNCSDGNACTQTDTCQAGACVGANPKVCTAQDQCHVAGVCDTTTGACTNPNANDNTNCSDGNACTQTDTCQAGVCVGSNPKVCPAQDQCHVAGTCNPSTGACSASTRASDGTLCSDGNRCSSGDSCHAGTCLPGTMNACTAQGAAHYVSVIDLGSAQGWSYASAINNSGVVVGTDVPPEAGIYQLGTPGSKGFFWTESDGMTYMPWTGAQSYAVDINDDGVIAISAGREPTALTPCRYDRRVDAQPVCNPYAGRAAGINAGGTVTGSSYWPAQAIRMFRMGTGPLETLPSAPDPAHDDRAGGAAIGPDGSVVGSQFLNGDWAPVRYTDSRGTEFLDGLLPSGSGWILRGAGGIQPGQILGWGLHDGHGRAFRMRTTPNGDVLDIVALPMPSTFAADAPNIMSVNKVNSSNEFVGSVMDSLPFWPQAAIVYTDAGGTVDLNTLIDPQSGWTLLAASGINNNHEVVGYGTRNGAYRAFKLTLPDLSPCPTDGCHVAVRDPLTGVCSSTVKPNGAACSDNNPCTMDDVCTNGICGGATTYTCVAPDTCHAAGTCDSVKPMPGPPSTQDLVGWWKLDGDGSDASGGGHDLTIKGNVTPAPGRIGTGMKFDGASCMTAPVWPEARMAAATGVTMMAWVRPDSVDCPVGQTALSVMGTGWDYSLGSWCWPGPHHAMTGGGRPAGATTWGYGGGIGQIRPGDWVHVTITWANNRVTIYFNGFPATSDALTSTFGDAESVFAIGCMITHYYTTGDQPIQNFHGTIDDVMLYRRALSPAEIAAYGTQADPCSHPALPDNTFCTDFNECTRTDRCQAGTCVGTNPVVCAAQDTCHTAGTCAPATGVCSNPAKPDGATCVDGQACTQSETCHAGTCVAPSTSYPVVLNLPVDYLGTFGPASMANDINAAGVSVGQAFTPDIVYHGWQVNGLGPITNLDDLAGLSAPSSAQAINDSNTIVGYQADSNGIFHGYRYGAAGLDVIPNHSSGPPANNYNIYAQTGVDVLVVGTFPKDINNAGDVIGFYTSGGTFQSFRYMNGVMEDIPTLVAGASTFLYGISETGMAVGASALTVGNFVKTHAVYYENELGGLRDLNDLVDALDPSNQWELLSASSINGDYIVGIGILNDDGVSRAYRLHRSSGRIDDLSGGWYTSQANKVTASGDTVGTGAVTAESNAAGWGAAFVYTDQLGFKNLNDIIPQDGRWVLTNASSINAAGDIVGHGAYWAGWGWSPYHLKLPPGQAATCKSRDTCVGGDGDAICLYSDGVVETSPGHFVAVFGFDNASSSSVHPSVNEVYRGQIPNQNLDPNPQPAPPADLPRGTHTGAFLSAFDADSSVTWKVNGESVTASATSPRLTLVPLPGGDVGVVIAGQTISFGCVGQPSGAACADDGNLCTRDICDGSVACQHPPADSGTVCRPSVGECDVAETCSGTTAECPADGKKASGTVCTDDGIVCTNDACDGTSATCQHTVNGAGQSCLMPAAARVLANVQIATATLDPVWSTAYQRIDALYGLSGFRATVTAGCGFDPLEDFDGCLVAVDDIDAVLNAHVTNFVALCRGQWDRGRLEACIRVPQTPTADPPFFRNGVEVLGGDNRPFLAFLADDTLAIGSHDWLMEAIDRFVSPTTPVPPGSPRDEAIRLASFADANSTAWVAALVAGSSLAHSDASLKPVTGITAWLDFQVGLNSTFRFETDSPASAATLAQAFVTAQGMGNLPAIMETLGISFASSSPQVSGAVVTTTNSRTSAQLLATIDRLFPPPGGTP